MLARVPVEALDVGRARTPSGVRMVRRRCLGIILQLSSQGLTEVLLAKDQERGEGVYICVLEYISDSTCYYK